MMASTARIIGYSSFWKREVDSELSLASLKSSGFRLDPDLGEIEIGAAAHAHRVVELDDLAAGRALAADLVALGPVRERDQESEHRHDRADQRPDEERGPPDAAHDPGRETEPDREQQVDHNLRTAQITA